MSLTYDVADEGRVAAIVGRVVRALGRLDMAFNHAGIMVAQTDELCRIADRSSSCAAQMVSSDGRLIGLLYGA